MNSPDDTKGNMTAIKPTTPGEELYQVHLRRLREEEDDHDYVPRKRRSSSVGEELWEVHRRRNLGIEDDLDRDIEETDNSDKKDKKDLMNTTPAKKSDAPKCSRYNLRSKDVSIKKA